MFRLFTVDSAAAADFCILAGGKLSYLYICCLFMNFGSKKMGGFMSDWV